MMPSEAATSSAGFNYAVFSFVKDRIRSQTVPIGVVLWSSHAKQFRFRLIGEREQLQGLKKADYLPYVALLRRDLEFWLREGQLFYQGDQLAPSNDAWWQHVAKLLQHQVWLSSPKPIDCRDPDLELEPLYESMISPSRPPKAQRTHIAGEIKRCLDGLGREFKAKPKLHGYGGRDVEVMRAYQGRRALVVIDGVNLATKHAEMLSDATASRLERLLQGQSAASCKLLLGYLPSPEGLNGDEILVKSIQERTGARPFDLRRQREELRDAAAASMAQADAN
jgi:hypothetical protein